MSSNKRFDNQRGRGDDRDYDYSGQQGGYRSGQMGQFEDPNSRKQGDWTTGEDYHSQGQMGGSSGSGYDRDQPSRFHNRDDDDFRYGQNEDDHTQSFGNQGRGYPSGSTYGENQYGGARNYGGAGRSQDHARGSSGYGSSAGSRGAYPSGFSGDYRRSRDQWSQNDYDGRNVSRPYGANYSQQPKQEDFGSWREYGEKRGFFDRASDEIASWFGDEDASRRREQDHGGRGPSNYKRSDDRIQEDANEHLTRDWRVDATNITVSVQNGEVTLEGHLPTRDAKRRAEDCVEDISGVKHVQNNLRVHHVESRNFYGSGQGGGSFGSSSGSSGHNLTSTSSSDGTGNATTGVGTTAPGATGSTGSTGASNKN